MKGLFSGIIVLFFVLLIGCQPQQKGVNDMDKDTIKKEVKEQFDKLVVSINKINAEEWSGFYSKDEFASAFVSTELYKDRKAWVDTISSYFKMRDKQKVTVNEVNITPLAADAALMTSKEASEMVLKDGSAIKSQHVFTMVWKKEKEGWKILHSHESWIDTPAK